MTPAQLLEKMTSAPANIFSLPGGILAAGQPADLTLIDPAAEWAVDTAEFLSKGRNNPFHGKTLTGRVLKTWVGGKCVYQERRRERTGQRNDDA